jgi:hypothetical protein
MALFNTPPIALTATLTTNLLNPGSTTGGVNCTAAPYDKLRLTIYQLRVVNKTAVAHNFTMYKGATGANAAGTEIAFQENVPANSETNVYFQSGLVLTTADFIVGGADALTSLVAIFFGEIDVLEP